MARLIAKKSTVAAKVPLAADLEIGELAVNTADAKLYTKHNDGNVVGIKADPTGAAGGVLSGSYPNPGFAVDMATQAELDAVNAAKVDKVAGKGLSTEDYTTAEKNKLAGIASGATANATDAQLRDRATHTGSQAISTVTGLQGALDAKEAAGTAATAVSSHVAAGDPHPQYTTAAEAAAAAPVQSVAGKTGAVTLAKADVGLSNADNTSDANKPVSTAQAAAIATAITNHINAADPHTQYAKESDLGNAAGLDVGTTAGTVAAGDDARLSDSRPPTGAAGGVLSGSYPNPGFAVDMATQAELDAHANSTSNPHATTAAQVGADPAGTAAAAVAAHAAALDPHPTYTTAAEAAAAAPVQSVAGRTGAVTLAKGDVGLGNVDNTADSAKPVSTAQQTALNLKANIASPTFTGTVNGITKSMVGLGNVDNTSDASKPVSTAQAAAIATATAIHPFLLIGA